MPLFRINLTGLCTNLVSVQRLNLLPQMGELVNAKLFDSKKATEILIYE